VSKQEIKNHEFHRAGFRSGMERAAKIAEDTSALIVQPGNAFDAGYSQGRFEAAARIRVALSEMAEAKS
jgi:hypothetical protein